MCRPLFFVGLLVAAVFSLATALAPMLDPAPSHRQAPGVLGLLLGGGRQLIAEHLHTKADVYLHAGYYPSVFDREKLHEGSAVSGGADSHNDRADIFGPPRDWLDRLGRNFYPSKHTHLGDGKPPGAQREILPWLKLSASLDPHRVESYTVAAYWLTAHVNNPDQAEAFLREGWRHNPDSYEIIFELGRLMEDHHRDVERARNFWELALRKWDQRNAGATESDTPARAQILGHLARLEQRAGNSRRAIELFEALKPLSPHPQAIQFQIDELRGKLP